MCSSRTWSKLSYVDLQSHTPYYQHTVTCRAIELTKVQSITSNQISYPESSLPGCRRANGERQEQNVRTLQQNCKGSTFTAPESESVFTSSPQCNEWIPATVTKTPVASQQRSYSVETTKRLLRYLPRVWSVATAVAANDRDVWLQDLKDL